MKFNAGLFENPCGRRRPRRRSPNGAEAQRAGAQGRRANRWCCSRTTARCRWRCPAAGAKPTIAVIGPNAGVGAARRLLRHPAQHGLAARRDQGAGRQHAPISSPRRASRSPRTTTGGQDKVELGDPAENAPADRRRRSRRRRAPTPSCCSSATPSRPAAKAGPTATSATAPRSTSSASRTTCSMRSRRSASRSSWCW